MRFRPVAFLLSETEDGAQQEFLAFSSASQRSRGLQLEGRASSVTRNEPSCRRGDAAQYRAIGISPSLTSKVSLADGSSCTWSDTFRMIAANFAAYVECGAFGTNPIASHKRQG